MNEQLLLQNIISRLLGSHVVIQHSHRVQKWVAWLSDGTWVLGDWLATTRAGSAHVRGEGLALLLIRHAVCGRCELAMYGPAVLCCAQGRLTSERVVSREGDKIGSCLVEFDGAAGKELSFKRDWRVGWPTIPRGEGRSDRELSLDGLLLPHNRARCTDNAKVTSKYTTKLLQAHIPHTMTSPYAYLNRI